MQPSDLEPISPARRGSIIEAIAKHGHYEGSSEACRFHMAEVTNPRHCIAWRVKAAGRWHAGYAATVDEARIWINKHIVAARMAKEARPVQNSLFE